MKENKKINLGISILRMWMAFEVVLLHRMSWKGYEGVFYGFLKSCELFSVPVFMIVSFYFSAKLFEENNDDKFIKRLIKLIIPQVGWAIICWVVYFLTDVIFVHEVSHGFNDLVWAIISGCRKNTNPSTWFQAVLILLTLYFYLLFKICRKKTGWLMVYVSFILAIIIQIEGSYFNYFSNTAYELFNTVGRIFEIMPFACTGLILRHLDVAGFSKGKELLFIGICLCLFFVGFHIPFTNLNKDFFGGPYPLYMSLMLFVIFLLLPVNDVSDNTRNIILTVTKFTLGIYCAHRMVYGIMDIVYDILGIELMSFSKCILTYLACYIMSLIMYQIPLRFVKNLVD